MSDSISEPLIITIVGGVIVGLILLAINKIDFKTIFLKTRIRNLLKKYEEIRLDLEKERNAVRKLGQLLNNGKTKFINSGFGFEDNDTTIQNDLFKIHITRIGNSIMINKFLLTRIEDNSVYCSEDYPESQKENNDSTILLDFVENL